MSAGRQDNKLSPKFYLGLVFCVALGLVLVGLLVSRALQFDQIAKKSSLNTPFVDY